LTDKFFSTYTRFSKNGTRVVFLSFFEEAVIMKKLLGKLFIASVAGMFMIATMAGIGFAADTIKLGVAGPHSGDLASYGIPTVKAAELVVKEVNAKGGVLGKKVELLVEDDVCKPEVATNSGHGYL
jgi:branched-chain amino acid transport system substrate-binding protein